MKTKKSSFDKSLNTNWRRLKIDLWTTKSELSHDARLFWRGWNSFDCFQQKNYDLHFWTPSSLTFVITFCMIYHLGWNQGNIIMLGSILFVSEYQGNHEPYSFLSTQKRYDKFIFFDYWCMIKMMHWLNFSNQFSRDALLKVCSYGFPSFLKCCYISRKWD